MGKSKLANIAEQQHLNIIQNALIEKTNKLLLELNNNSSEIEDVSLAIAELMTQSYLYLYKTDLLDQFKFDFNQYVKTYG